MCAARRDGGGGRGDGHPELAGPGAAGDDLESALNWQRNRGYGIPLRVTRVILPDSSGIPALQGIAILRDVVAAAGGGPLSVEPRIPVDVIVDCARRPDMTDSGVQEGKNHRAQEKTVLEGILATQTLEVLAPRPQDILIAKRKSSSFFGTIFMSQLNFFDVDALILTGCTTSGCLRATAVDAYSYDFKVIVPEETAFDRFQATHAMNLFDLNCKYADVIPTTEVQSYLNGLPEPALLPDAAIALPCPSFPVCKIC